MAILIMEVHVSPKYVLTFLLVFLFGCAQKQSDQLTQQQKVQITKDVRAVVDSMIATAERLDGEAGLQFYWDSPDFVAVNPDGSLSDYQAIKKMSDEGVKTISVMTMSTTRAEFRVLTKEIVICAWKGKGEVALKTGDKMTYDPDVLTLVFRNFDGKWKIVYSHESATVVTQKATKK
jgi:uncharacterized protein (TIGR02246 family)